MTNIFSGCSMYLIIYRFLLAPSRLNIFVLFLAFYEEVCICRPLKSVEAVYFEGLTKYALLLGMSGVMSDSRLRLSKNASVADELIP